MHSITAFIRYLFNNILSPIYGFVASVLIHRTYTHVFYKHVSEWKPDIIHAHDIVTLELAAKISRETGAKLVFDSHELEAHRSPRLSIAKRFAVRRLERKYLPSADKVVTVGEKIADHLASAYRIEPPIVVYNAPPLRRRALDRWATPDRADVRSDLNLGKNVFLFAYTGNAGVYRGFALAIIALSLLRDYEDPNERFTEFHLVAVGAIEEANRAAIGRIAAKYGVEERVHVLPPVSPDTVSSYISTANATIVPIFPTSLSYEYCMPNKLFEALHSGLPILASDLCEMGPFVRNQNLGLTFAADEPDDCANKMLTLIDRYTDFEDEAHQRIELSKIYSWEEEEKKILEIYNSLSCDKSS